jgi:hypothetical protein
MDAVSVPRRQDLRAAASRSTCRLCQWADNQVFWRLGMIAIAVAADELRGSN